MIDHHGVLSWNLEQIIYSLRTIAYIQYKHLLVNTRHTRETTELEE